MRQIQVFRIITECAILDFSALKSFEKAAKLDSSKELSKNLLLANLANGNTAEAKKYAAAADAQAKAAMAAAEGDYKAAAKNLEGYNAAIALVQSNDLAGAKNTTSAFSTFPESEFIPG